MLCKCDKDGLCVELYVKHDGRVLQQSDGSANYRVWWGPLSPAVKSGKAKTCIHLGARAVDAQGNPQTRDCPTCPDGPQGKKVHLKVFNCQLHGEITLLDCGKCGDYKPRETASAPHG